MSKKWREYPINEICTAKQWPTIPARDLIFEGYPVYGANGLIGYYKEYNHEDKTILITCRGATCGTINISEPKSYVTGNAMCLDDLDQEICDLRFVYYALVRRGLKDTITGSAQPQITRQSLEKVKISLPPLSEQKRIATILDKADTIRRKRQAAIIFAENFLDATFLYMFGDPVTNPKEWRVETVGDMLSFLTSGSRGWAQYYSKSGALFLRIQNVGNNDLILNEIAFVNPPPSAEARRTKVQPGDVLLTITADLGRTAVIPDGFPPAHINQHIAILRFQGIEPLYASAFLASSGGQKQINRLNRGGVKAGLNFDDIKSLKMMIPPEQLQKEWKYIYEKKQVYNNKVQYASIQDNKLFNSLTQRAFRGEL